MNIAVIIPAAGLGQRFAAAEQVSRDPFGERAAPATSKIELDLRGRPVFLRSVELFLHRAPKIGQILLAVNPDAVEQFRFKWSDMLNLHGVEIVPGGRKERWETVANALEVVAADATHVAVHDAARPLATAKLIDRVIEAAARYTAVIPALPVASTLKRIDPQVIRQDEPDPLDAILGAAGKSSLNVQRVIETVSRANLVEVQTPQVFEISLLRRAYAQIADGRIDPSSITDDAGLVEALGEPVHVVEGEVTNLKITRAEDVEFAQAIVQHREARTAAATARKRLFADEDE
jgi:2-C-methyl-D-erythritol 4-phosphate cytidylyltransferase